MNLSLLTLVARVYMLAFGSLSYLTGSTLRRNDLAFYIKGVFDHALYIPLVCAVLTFCLSTQGDDFFICFDPVSWNSTACNLTCRTDFQHLVQIQLLFFEQLKLCNFILEPDNNPVSDYFVG